MRSITSTGIDLLRSCAPRSFPGHIKKWLFALAMLAFSFVSSANGGTPPDEVSGSISYPDGKPASGILVRNLTTGKTTLTDKEGKFTIAADKDDRLFIEADGFKVIDRSAAEIPAAITLEMLDLTGAGVIGKKPPVELLYMRTPSHLTAASTEALYSKDILKAPVTSLRSALTGRMAGLYSVQGSGQPGADGVSLSLRGYDPLIMIDGVVANLSIFNLDDVESVTLQKDALSTAMLGVRGSNGVLLVTTKKGKDEKHHISFTAQTSFQKSIGTVKPLKAFDYATLYNEAAINDGLPARYTQADLDHYKNGTDPFGHPDVDWRNVILKNSSRFDRYSLNASGGNKFARYYVSLEHINQTGFLITSDKNKYNTNTDFKSYVIRSNIDVSVNNNLTGGIYLLGRILNASEPGGTINAIFASLLNTPNNAYPVYNDNGSYGGNAIFQNNIMAQAVSAGYRLNYKRDMLANFYLKYKLDDITPGLWLMAKTAFNATISEDNFRGKTFAVYQMLTGPGPTVYNKYGNDGTQSNSNGIVYQGRSNYVEISAGYEKIINHKHRINALVLANRDNSVNGSDLPYTISGISGRVAYDLLEKYVAEIAFGYNGSNRYPPHGDFKRGLFPAIGLGWNMEKERFMRSQPWISRLKVFGSFGKTGWDDPGYFTYYQRFFDASGVIFGTGASGVTAITEQPLANPNIEWEKAQKFNVGVDAALFDHRLNVGVEYFNNEYYDLLQIRGLSTSLIGNDYPRENIGRNRYSGLELKLGWQQRTARGLQYFATANASWVKSKVLFSDEVFRPYEWMKRTGQRVNQFFGFIDEGLFQTTAEINTRATTVGYTPQPGDIRYKDLNSDGVIDQFDQAPIGRAEKPLFFFGLSLGAEYKGVDISLLLQGVTNRDVYAGGASFWAFQNTGLGQAYEHNLNRWTPANAATATDPRVNIGFNSNNQAASSYWVRNGDYVRLKQLEIGYNIPRRLLNRIRLDNIRVFVRGFNLFTIKSDELEDRDPEVFNGFNYPMQRLLSVGINIKL